MAWGDLEGVTGAAAAVRATDKAQLAGLLRRFDWWILEIDALIGLGRLGEAETALAEMEAVLPPAEPPSVLVAAAQLRGDLAAVAGHPIRPLAITGLGDPGRRHPADGICGDSRRSHCVDGPS